jgi:hypothetical protein
MFKKIHHFRLTLFLVLGYLTLQGQNRTLQFGDANNFERTVGIVTLPNNSGFIVAGTKETNGVASSYLRRVATDLSPTPIVWENSLSNTTITAMAAKDGTIFIVGRTGNEVNPKAFIYQINASNGVFSSILNASDSSQINGVHKGKDGFWYFTGFNIVTDTLLGSYKKPIVWQYDNATNNLVALNNFVAPLSFNTEGTAIAQTNNQRVWVAGRNDETQGPLLWNTIDSTLQILDKSSTASESSVAFLLPNASKNALFLGINKGESTTLFRYSQTGQLQKQASFGVQYHAAVVLDDNTLICTGSSGNKIVTTAFDSLFLVKWSKISANPNASSSNAFALDTIPKGIIVAGTTWNDTNNSDFWLQTLTEKQQIKGRVFVVSTCADIPIVPLSNWIVKGTVSNPNHAYYGVTDSLGFYTMELDTLGSGTIELEAASQIGFSTCQKITATIALGTITNVPDLLVIATDTFPNLIVDISAAYLHLNDTINYIVRVQNPRNKAVLDAKVVSTFAPELLPISPNFGNTVTTMLGTLPPHSDILFTIKRFLSNVNASPTRTYCAEAKVTPDNSAWQGPRYLIKGECGAIPDSVRFTIKNIGTTGFKKPTDGRYSIVIDEVILRIGTIKNLLPGEEMILSVYKNGFSTYVCIVEQGAENVYGSFAGGRVEACGTPNATDQTALTGITYPDFDDDLTYALDCQQATSTIPSSSKSIVLPLGFVPLLNGNIPTINDSITFEHKHRIVNRTNATAKTAVLDVAFPKQLSATQIEFGSYSHPYRVKIKDGNHLEFIFDHINLSPRDSNAAAAVAFVNFRIKMPLSINDSLFITQSSLAFSEVGALEPVDTVARLVKENGGFKFTLLSLDPVLPYANLHIAPNPFIGETFITVSEAWLGATFQLYSPQGQLLQQFPIHDTRFALSAADLPSGVYVCRIQKDEKVLAIGKVVH